MSSSTTLRRRISLAVAALGTSLVVALGGVAPAANAGNPPLQLEVTWQLYSYQLGAGTALFAQNGYIVDRATQIAKSLANCPLCHPNPSTPLPAGYLSTTAVAAFADGPNTLDVRLGNALILKGGAKIADPTYNVGGVGTWTKGNRTWAVVILADYSSLPLDEIPFGFAKIVGVPKVGQMLNAATDVGNPFDITYQWTVGGVDVGGATNPNYIVALADQGKKITVTISASANGYADRSRTSAAVGPVLPGLIYVPKWAALAGSNHVGQVLSVDTSRIVAPGVTFTYKWTRNGHAIAGATLSRYALQPADYRKIINVTVVASATGYRTVTVKTHNLTHTGAALVVM
jgi:hypothetical protein